MLTGQIHSIHLILFFQSEMLRMQEGDHEVVLGLPSYKMKERRKEVIVRPMSACKTKEELVIRVEKFTVLEHGNWCHPG